MAEIHTNQGKTILVDDEDFGFLNRFTWSLRRCMDRDYPITARKFDDQYHATYLHRMVMNAPPNMVVDHINGDTFGNRKSNLRICTQCENGRNRKANKGKIYKGVKKIKPRGQKRPRTKSFFAGIFYAGKSIRIGYFDTEEEAARAYDQKAKELFGEFANLNFPEPDIKLSNQQAAL